VLPCFLVALRGNDLSRLGFQTLGTGARISSRPFFFYAGAAMPYDGRFIWRKNDSVSVVDAKWVSRHQGTREEFLERYQKLAASAAEQKLIGLRKIAPELLRLISDDRTLHAAWKHLQENGSHVPGSDGVRYGDFPPSTVWKYLRDIRDEIRAGDFALQDEQVVRIPKGPGRGFRELVVQSIFDRVVQRAVVEILQPLLDPLFDPRSFGFRPKQGPLRALATAEQLYKEYGSRVWVSVDIKNAFPSVPVGRLLGVLRKYLPDDDLLYFIETVTRPEKRPGLRQGSPLSPLLLNLYLHHLLDRKWRTQHPELPLLRFADDILVMCRTPNRARKAYAALTTLIRDAGLELKEPLEQAVKRVSRGDELVWMGFGIRRSGYGLAYTVTEDAWAGLREKLESAHLKPLTPLAALATLRGWIADKGPCFPHADTKRAAERISELAKAQGFEEMPEAYEITAYWQRAYARWCKLRRKVATETVR